MVAHVGPWEPPPEPVEAKGKGKGGAAKGKKGAAPEAPVDPPGTVVVLAGSLLPSVTVKTLASDEAERARVEEEEAEKAAKAKEEEEERKAKEAAEAAAKGGKAKGKAAAAAAETTADEASEEDADPERAGFKVWETVSVCESGRMITVQMFLEAASE